MNQPLTCGVDLPQQNLNKLLKKWRENEKVKSEKEFKGKQSSYSYIWQYQQWNISQYKVHVILKLKILQYYHIHIPYLEYNPPSIIRLRATPFCNLFSPSLYTPPKLLFHTSIFPPNPKLLNPTNLKYKIN